MDAAKLERFLIEAARAGRSVSYRQTLALFGRRIGPNNVRALMRVLSEVCEGTDFRGEPDLACLVVREKDRLPGEGYFQSHARAGRYDGPSEGPLAAAFVAAEQARAFAFWARAGEPPFEEPNLLD